MRLHRISILAIILLFVSLPGLAADLFVYPDGSGVYATIQDAMDVVDNGDTIWLMPGTFSGPGNRDILVRRSVTITHGGPADECFIDVGGSQAEPHYAFRIEGYSASFYNITFSGGWAEEGGALYVNEAAVDLELCAFYDNAANDVGGAIFAYDECDLSLLRCRFARNSARHNGGGILARAGCQVTLSRCTFADNSAGWGGNAVYLEEGSSCDIDNTIIAFGHGAACADYYSTNYTAVNTDVYGNVGGDWSAGLTGLNGVNGNLHVDPELCDPLAPLPNLRLSQGSPCNNIAPHGFLGWNGPVVGWTSPVYGIRDDGSGMFATIQDALDAVPTGATVCLENGTYSGAGNRELAFDGRAVTLCARAATPDSCILHTDDYRALLLDGDEGEDTVIRGLQFSDTDAAHGPGGGVYVTGPSAARIENCLFDGIFSGEPGAAIRIEVDAATPATVALDGCRFHSIDTDLYIDGSVIRASGWDADIRNCEFHACYVGPSADSCVYIDDYPGALILNCSFSYLGAHTGSAAALYLADSPAAQVDLINCTFNQLWSNINGSICLSDAGAVTLSGCEFERCSADENGGCIHAVATETQQTLTVESCEFRGYDTPGDRAGLGAGIYAETLEALTIRDTDFINLSAFRGAGVYVDDTPLTVSDCLFEGNSADLGPALFAYRCDVQITSCEVTRNGDETCYGGGFNLNNSSGIVGNCRFTENYGENCASLRLYGGLEHFDVENCLFWNNTSHNNSTTFVTSCDATFSSCTWHGNRFETGGSVLNTASDALIEIEYCIISGTANGSAAPSYLYGGSEMPITCSDLYGNENGDWVGSIEEQFEYEGNLCELPLYCDSSAGDFSLNAASPCLADNNICVADIGRYGQGCSGGVGVEETAPVVTVPTLRPNFPNPFNPATTIAYDLPAACDVSLRIVDVEGRLIATLRDGRAETAGAHAVVWRGKDAAGNALPSGFYFAVLSADGVESTQRMLLLK